MFRYGGPLKAALLALVMGVLLIQRVLPHCHAETTSGHADAGAAHAVSADCALCDLAAPTFLAAWSLALATVVPVQPLQVQVAPTELWLTERRGLPVRGPPVGECC